MRVALMIASGGLLLAAAVTGSMTLIGAGVVLSVIGLALHVRRHVMMERQREAYLQWVVRDVVPTEQEIRENRVRAMRRRCSEGDAWR